MKLESLPFRKSRRLDAPPDIEAILYQDPLACGLWAWRPKFPIYVAPGKIQCHRHVEDEDGVWTCVLTIEADARFAHDGWWVTG